MLSKNCPIIGEHLGVNFGGQYVTMIATAQPALKAKMKAVFNRFYSHYGNLLYKNDDCNLFTRDWASV